MAISEEKLRELFSRRLRDLRLAAGISQRTLGRQIGLSEETVSSRVTRYEKGTSEPNFTTANKLAKELGVPLAYLVADTDVLAEIIAYASRLPAAEQKRLAHSLKEQLAKAKGD